jgi:hypothetical protein
MRLLKENVINVREMLFLSKKQTKEIYQIQKNEKCIKFEQPYKLLLQSQVKQLK